MYIHPYFFSCNVQGYILCISILTTSPVMYRGIYYVYPSLLLLLYCTVVYIMYIHPCYFSCNVQRYILCISILTTSPVIYRGIYYVYPSLLLLLYCTVVYIMYIHPYYFPCNFFSSCIEVFVKRERPETDDFAIKKISGCAGNKV